MTDDIVTRLREHEAIADNAYVINALVTAADEIERLQAMLVHGLTQGSTCGGCSICEELKAFHKKVVPGD